MSNQPLSELSEETKQEEQEVEFVPEGDSYLEQLLRSLIQGYQEAYNKNNPKYEIKYYLTITNHKIATKEGNKDIAYLRLERAIREKEKKVEIVDPTKDEVTEPEWAVQLVHNEMYAFKSMAERVNPKALWKEQLWLNTFARLTGAGLEYAELLQRMKNTNLKEMKEQEEKKLDLVITDQMPKALTPDEEGYKEWVQKHNINAKQ
jgi:hypothetical protein